MGEGLGERTGQEKMEDETFQGEEGLRGREVAVV